MEFNALGVIKTMNVTTYAQNNYPHKILQPLHDQTNVTNGHQHLI